MTTVTQAGEVPGQFGFGVRGKGGNSSGEVPANSGSGLGVTVGGK